MCKRLKLLRTPKSHNKIQKPGSFLRFGKHEVIQQWLAKAGVGFEALFSAWTRRVRGLQGLCRVHKK